MREYKFRGKNFEKQWAYGDLIQYKSGECAIFSEKLSKYGHEAAEIINRDQIDPESVGQCTGKTDEYNNRKIYEGDIYKKTEYKHGEEYTTYWLVIWEEEKDRFRLMANVLKHCQEERFYETIYLPLTHIAGEYMEFVGAAYDNSDIAQDIDVC